MEPNTNDLENWARSFATVFGGRRDARGTLPGGCVKEPLELSHIINHINGEESLGLYLLFDNGTCKAAVVDFDFKSQANRVELSEKTSRRVAKKLFELGLKSYWFERSKSGMIHLWLFFSEPVEARKVRRILRFAARELNLKIANGIVEIFPKQDELSNGQVGNYIHLPYFGSLNGQSLDRRVMIDPNTFEPISLETFLERVQETLISPMELDMVVESLPKGDSKSQETSNQNSNSSESALQRKKEKMIEILRKYWTEGYRQDLSMYLAGFLAKQRIPWPEVANLILEIATLSNDSETSQRIAAIKATYEKGQKGHEVKGHKGLQEILTPVDLEILTSLFNDEPFEPIPVPKYPVLPFPLEVFPESIQKILNEFSKAVYCPVDFFGVPLLVEAGVAIGTSRALAIKPGWVEGPRINGAVVSDPGSRKSPALNLAMSPIYKIQKQMQSQYAEEKQKYEKELERYEKELKEWNTSDGNGQKPEKPTPPIMKQIFTTDSTLEALADLLKQNPRGLLFQRDELTGWAQSMDQYRGGRGADRQSWLSFWNGSPVIVNRKNRKEPIILDNPFVGVVGCLPPDVLGDLADERGREDGFIHRLLFSYPDPIPPEWVEDEIT